MTRGQHVQTSCLVLVKVECVKTWSNRLHSGSGLVGYDPRSTRCPEFSQGSSGETSWFSEDFLEKPRKCGIRGQWHSNSWVVYLHESVAFFHKRAAGDLLEGLAHVRQWPGLFNQSLVVVDQCQRHTEQDFWALVEQAIPNSKNSLRWSSDRTQRTEHVSCGHVRSELCVRYKVWLTSTGRTSM